MNKAAIHPYRRTPAHRDVGIVFKRGYADVEDCETGIYHTQRIEDVPEKVALYIGVGMARSWLKSGVGEAVKYNDTLSRYYVHGRELYLLPSEIGNVSLADLMMFRDFVEEAGGSVRSKSGTAVTLLRASLQGDKPIRLSRGSPPPFNRIIGGRIHGTGFDMHPLVNVWDISAAYASTLAGLRTDGIWRRGTLNLDSDRFEQFAEVTIQIPDLPFGPLPLRSAYPARNLWWDVFGEREFPSGRIAGTWSADELRAAIASGARILRVHQAWRLLSSKRQPFWRWWEIIQRGRELPGKAGALVKIVGNVLWGVFAPTGGEREWVHYEKKTRKRIAEPMESTFPTGWHADYPLAELITSKVRAKVYTELIVPAGDHFISCCVDGGLTKPGFEPQGSGWRLKDQGQYCAFLKPFVYAYERADGRPVYKWAGVPDEQKAQAFRTLLTHVRDWPRDGNPSDRRRWVHRMLQAFEGSFIERNLDGAYVDTATLDYVKGRDR